ncbi:MAG TPA: acyl-CoA dehydrogenase family protein [Solirubrobacterales bacterium]|nr:acyl-CoA dehydrogenase family protein [Solirubrobacterales bacterium]
MTVVKDSGARATLPPFNEEHEELRETVSRFVTKEIAPNVDEWEAAREFPRELFSRCAELGFLGLKFPEELGGQGGTHLHDAVWVEELARSGGSGGVAAGLNAHTSIAMPPIFNFGTTEQKQRWLVPGIAGEKIGALGITEPGAGSDVASLATTARRDGDSYIVNGSKTFITNGVRADFLVCACKTSEEGGHGGISFLVLESEMPGYEVSAKLEKMGWHSSDTGEISFTDVEVPAENLLGEEGQGFRYLMRNLAQERLAIAITAAAGARGALDRTLEYVKERQAFGRPVGTFQNSRFRLAACHGEMQVTQAHVDSALARHIAGELTPEDAAIAKWWATESQGRIVDACLQLHGGYGYMVEYPISRAYADARVNRIYGGSNEIMLEIVGRSLGLGEPRA